MRYVKRNRLTIFILIIFTILVLIGAYIYNIFFVSGRKEAYGNRLDGIENVVIDDEVYNSIRTDLEANEKVTKVTTELRGKIVYVIITVADDVNKEDAKKIGETVSTYQLAFYDIQVFVKKENAELNDFPIIGYKQNGAEKFTWTKDRQVTKDESE